MARITFHVAVHPDSDGSYWAEVKELPGCFASGFSVDELVQALEEAIQMCLPDGVILENPTWDLGDLAADKPAPAGARELVVCG